MWIDDVLFRSCSNQLEIQVYNPSQVVVVVGKSNKIEREVHLDRCLTDGIQVLRRSGGGGAVVLHPGCLVISVGAWVRQLFNNKYYFDLINGAVIHSLRYFIADLNLTLAGISDIAYHNRKLAGTSLFRSGNYLLYQGSILVEDRSELFNRYLQHPSREPDYREGKEHGEFVTAIDQIGHGKKIDPVMFKPFFQTHLNEIIKSELIEPEDIQVRRIQQRTSPEQELGRVLILS